MQLGMIGLGRMGAGMVRRPMMGRRARIVHHMPPEAVATLRPDGDVGAVPVGELVAKLAPLRDPGFHRDEMVLAPAMRRAFGGHVENPAEHLR